MGTPAEYSTFSAAVRVENGAEVSPSPGSVNDLNGVASVSCVWDTHIVACMTSSPRGSPQLVMMLVLYTGCVQTSCAARARWERLVQWILPRIITSWGEPQGWEVIHKASTNREAKSCPGVASLRKRRGRMRALRAKPAGI